MQLAGQNTDPDQKISPSIYAALVDSLFQNPGPMFAGAVFAAKAADDLISLIPAEPQRTAFAEAAIRAGARLDRPRKPVRGKSRNVLAKIHNSFVTPKTQAA